MPTHRQAVTGLLRRARGLAARRRWGSLALTGVSVVVTSFAAEFPPDESAREFSLRRLPTIDAPSTPSPADFRGIVPLDQPLAGDWRVAEHRPRLEPEPNLAPQLAASLEGDHLRERPQRLPPVEEIAVPDTNAGSDSGVGSAAPPSWEPWWQAETGRQLLDSARGEYVDLNQILMLALAHSPRVRAISDQPLIEETAVVEAAAEFDPRSFLESKYVSLSDPVGNTLTTGGPLRFRQQDYQLSAGIRKKNQSGGTWELSQRIGKLSNNSVFLVPPQQGNARLSLSYTQPMLRGAGQFYNTSLIVLAELDTQIAGDQAAAQLQEHLLEVTEAYGTLQLQRAALLQRRRLAERAAVILEELEARQDLDAMPSQIARTRAALALRQAQLVRSETEILNAETRLRNLVGLPALGHERELELIPVFTAPIEPISVSVEDAFVTAIRHRPEFDEAVQQTRAAEVRVGMAEQDTLASLDFVLESYVAGLAGNFQTGNAFGDQFTEGQPGFTAGFVFESPWGNRAALAKLRRRELESRQSLSRFQDTLSTLRAEVEVAVREIETVRRELEGHRAAIEAAEADIQMMEERWRLLPGNDGTRSFLLEDLLRAQERLAAAEYDYAYALYRCTIAIAELKRALGTLLQRDDINVLPPGVEQMIP